MKEKLIEVQDIVWSRDNRLTFDPLEFTKYGIAIKCEYDFLIRAKSTVEIPNGKVKLKASQAYVMLFDSAIDHLKLTHKFFVVGAHRNHYLKVEVFNDSLEEIYIPEGKVVAYAVILNNVTTKFFEISPNIMERSF